MPSALAEAQAGDEELAEETANQAKDDKVPRGPRLSEFSPEYRVLLDVFDRLGEITAAVIQSGGGKPRMPTPAPRPITALDRVIARRRRHRHESLVAEVKEAQERWAATHGSG